MQDSEFELIEQIVEQHLKSVQEMIMNAIAAISEAGQQ